MQTTLCEAVKRYTAPGSFLRQPEITAFFPERRSEQPKSREEELQQTETSLDARGLESVEESACAEAQTSQEVQKELPSQRLEEGPSSDFGAAGEFKSKRIIKALGWTHQKKNLEDAEPEPEASASSQRAAASKKKTRELSRESPGRGQPHSKRRRLKGRQSREEEKASSKVPSSPSALPEVVGAETKEEEAQAALEAVAFLEELQVDSIEAAAEEAANAL